MTKVLQLDYYDMSVRELRQRVAAQGARDATPQLDFDSSSAKPDLRGYAPGLQDNAGLRVLDERLKEAAERQEQMANNRAEKSLGKQGGMSKLKMVSLTDAQYEAANTQGLRDDMGGEGAKGEDVDEDALSTVSDSEDEEFDGQAMMRRQEARWQHKDTSDPWTKIQIDGDEAIRKLMEMPVDQFFRRDFTGAVDDADSKAKSPEQEEEDKNNANKQDVFLVRRTLRMVYRNMPHNDFVSLINYLLRALQTIKHAGGHIYWHADDPSFKHVLGEKGTNEYTRYLLLQLGFIRLTEVHWVWPDPIFNTQYKIICKEVDKMRLDLMLVVLKSCQMSLYKTGTHFTGNFTLLR
uniref:Uncharacterized protein n=1 Tax=Alexandrium catenella TaxID=2925 RepID=A0A7S1L747_ALECA